MAIFSTGTNETAFFVYYRSSEVVCRYLAQRILENKHRHARIVWMTPLRLLLRFLRPYYWRRNPIKGTAFTHLNSNNATSSDRSFTLNITPIRKTSNVHRYRTRLKENSRCPSRATVLAPLWFQYTTTFFTMSSSVQV